MKLGRYEVGPKHPTYFIADAASNHDGDLEKALELISVAKASGAQAVKFQHFKAETIVSDYGFKQLGSMSHQSTWKKSVYETYKENECPVKWMPLLWDRAKEEQIDLLTSPYDISFLQELAPYVCAWKLGSGDITWHAMIEAMCRTDKPIIMATGASTEREVVEAYQVCKFHGKSDVVIMQCNTNYTGAESNFNYVNLNVLRGFDVTVCGLSDHTHGHTTVLGAVALGARVIEKHLTYSEMPLDGPDHSFSMTPTTFLKMVVETRRLEAALGDGEKRVEDNEIDTRVLQRRALRATRDLKAGQAIQSDHIVALRPCPVDALPPYADVLGKILVRDVEKGDYLRSSDFLWSLW